MMKDCKTHNFSIAELPIRIVFKDDGRNGMHLLPSLEPFRQQSIDKDDLLFSLIVDDSLQPHPKEERERIRVFDTGNGDTIVDLLPDGGYQYIIKDLNGKECSLLITDKHFTNCRCALNGNYNMRAFGLNNALMLTYAFAASYKSALLLHASLVRQEGFGYAFIAKSGTGKSTQVSMWLRHLPGCDLMNDDNPVVRFVDGEALIYGSPWSGKTPCYRNVKAKLGAITRIDRHTTNYVEKVEPVEAFASMITSVSTMQWDKDIFDNICNTITRIIETTDIYTLHCLPNKEAAVVCNKTIKKQA